MARLSKRVKRLRKLGEIKSNLSKKNVLRPRKKVKKGPKKAIKKKIEEKKPKPAPSEITHAARRAFIEKRKRLELQRKFNLQKANLIKVAIEILS